MGIAREPDGATIPWTEEEVQRFGRLCGLRAQVTGYAAREAAVRVAAGAATQAVDEEYAGMCRAARERDYAAFLEADMAFHREVCALADVPLLVAIWEMMEGRFRQFTSWIQETRVADLEIVVQTHRMQLETIHRGLAREAERAVHVDLDAMWQIVSQQSRSVSDTQDPVGVVCSYLMQNLHRRLTLAAVAREVAHLSPTHLAKLMRRSRGESFTAHLQGLRMRRAAVLLETTAMPVQDVATRIGYQHISRFGTHFRRRYGVTPSEFRKESNSHTSRG